MAPTSSRSKVRNPQPIREVAGQWRASKGGRASPCPLPTKKCFNTHFLEVFFAYTTIRDHDLSYQSTALVLRKQSQPILQFKSSQTKSTMTSTPHSPARSTSSNEYPSDDGYDWVKETDNKGVKDARKQPWKKTFGDGVDNRVDNGEDLVEVKEDNPSDDKYIFKVQENTLAA